MAAAPAAPVAGAIETPVRGVRAAAYGGFEVALPVGVLVALMRRLSALRASKSQVSTWSGGALGGARVWLGLTCIRVKSLEPWRLLPKSASGVGSLPPSPRAISAVGPMTILSSVLAIRI